MTLTGTKSWARRTSHWVCVSITASLPGLHFPAMGADAAAQMPDQEVLVIVKGVAVPFSVFGIVKSLSQIPGVEHVSFDLSQGLADLRIKPGAQITDEQIRKAVRNASYTPGSIRWKSAPGDHADQHPPTVP